MFVRGKGLLGQVNYLRGIVVLVVLLGLSALVAGCGPALEQLSSPASEADHMGSTPPLSGQGVSYLPCASVPSTTTIQQITTQALATPEVQALQQALAARGQSLAPAQAQGCKVIIPKFVDDATVVALPAGANASLGLVQLGSDSNAWASLAQADSGGQWLTHLEAGLESEGAPVAGTSFYLPSATDSQDILSQVQQWYAGAGQGSTLNWGQGQVVLLNATASTAIALLALPPAPPPPHIPPRLNLPAPDSSAYRTVTGAGLDPATASYIAVQVQRKTTTKYNRLIGDVVTLTRWLVVPGNVPVAGVVLQPNPPAPKLPAPPQVNSVSPPTGTPPPIALGGSLGASFALCPHLNDVAVGEFAPELCQGYSGRWLQQRWEYDVRPTLYSGIAQVSNQVSQALKQPGISFYPDPKMGVLLAGFQNSDPQTVQALRNLALQKGYLSSSGLVGQGFNVGDVCIQITSLEKKIGILGKFLLPLEIASVTLCLSDILSIYQTFAQWLQQQPATDVATFFNNLQILGTCAQGQPACPYADYNTAYTKIVIGNTAFGQFIQGINSFLDKLAGGNQTLADTMKSAVSIWIEAFLAVTPPEDVQWLIQDLGPQVVVEVGLIVGLQDTLDPTKINQQVTSFPYANSQGHFDLQAFFSDIKKAEDYISKTCPAGSGCHTAIPEDLVNLAAGLALYALNGDMSGFYEVQATLEMANHIIDHNVQDPTNSWTLQRLWFQLPKTWGGGIVDLIVTGQFKGDNITGYILIQPFLTMNDVSSLDPNKLPDLINRIIGTIQLAINGGPAGVTIPIGSHPDIYVVLSVGYDPNALSQLEQTLTNLAKNTPGLLTISIVDQNGNVIWSTGPDSGSAQQICQSMGICSPPVGQPGPSGSSPPPPGGSGGPPLIEGTTTDSCQAPTNGTEKICIQGLSIYSREEQ